MADEITISFDGVEVTTQPGKMVLEAAIDAGIYVPYLCYHPGMKPFAACRMCVVAVEGQRGFPASCTLPVQDGMRVRNAASDVDQLRHSVMEMLIAEHPNGCLTCHRIDICGPGDICLRHVAVNDRCVTCPKNERCELKDTVRYLGMNLESPLDYKYRQIPLEVADPFYDRDYNLCIVCGRCVRACDEIRGDSAIAFTERSGQALVGASFGASLLESGCEFCGACIDVCPVGALVERDHKWEKARRVERSVCPHCPVGCQLNLEFNDRDQLIRAIPEINSPANRGQACFKGKFGLEYVNDPARLTAPLLRRNGLLQEASWEEALDYVAARLPGYTGKSFALLTSPTSTNEEHYLAQKFARSVMGSNNVDHTSNTHPELVLELEHSLGIPAATNSIWDLAQAGSILVFNSNLTEEQNVVGIPIKQAARKETKLVVIDSREVELTRYAHVWLRPVPGTELLLLGGLLSALIEEGLEDEEWLAENCESPAALLYALHSLDMDEVSRITGVSLDAIADAARAYGEAASGSIVYGLDNLPADLQRGCVQALVDLALLTGNLGRPGSGLMPMRKGANEQGAWDCGCIPDRLPGYRRVASETDRQAVEEVWGAGLFPISGEPGLGLTRIIESAQTGGIKAALVIGDSPNFTNGHLGDALSALESLELLIVHDSFLTPLAQRADVVLPRVTFAEKEGTFTNLERRVQRVKPGRLSKEGEAQPESWLICQLAQRLGADGFGPATPAGTMAEIARVSPIYAGISYDKLEAQGSLVLRTQLESPQPTQVLYASKEDRGIQWPCPGVDDTGTPTLYQGGFGETKADTVTPFFTVAGPEAETDHLIWFVPGRVLLQQERPLEIIKGKRNRLQREEWIEINPADGVEWSLEEGAKVVVDTGDEQIPGVVRYTDSVPRSVAATTGLFGQLAIEMEASGEFDPAAMVRGLHIKRARIVQPENETGPEPPARPEVPAGSGTA